MGLLRWLRGNADTSSTAAAAGALVELDATLSPAKRQQIENLETLELLREDDAESSDTGRSRQVNLDKNTALLRLAKHKPEATVHDDNDVHKSIKN